MPEKKLVDFLKQARDLKLNLETIGRELVKAGWSIKDVDEALKSVKPFRAPAAPLKAPKAPSAVSVAKPEAKPEPREVKEEKEEEEFKAPKAPAVKPKPEAKPKVKEEKKEELSEAEKTAIERIKKLRAQGLSDEQIWAAFVGKGWKAEVIGKLIEKKEE